MDKRFICLVPCKPYDNFEKIIEGVRELKNGRDHRCKIEALIAFSDAGQLSQEAKRSFPEIRFGTFSIGSNGSSQFSRSVEHQIFKDAEAEFIIVGGIGQANAKQEELLALKEKVKSSVMSGLPVLLQVYSQDTGSGDQLKAQLIESLQDLSAEERDQVSIVFDVECFSPQLTDARLLHPMLDNCRLILKEIAGEEYAKNVKILLQIPKFAPEWLEFCIEDKFDGVCVNPAILSKLFCLPPIPKEEDAKRMVPKKEIQIEQQVNGFKVEGPAPEKKKIENVSLENFISSEQRNSLCFVYCHVFDDLEQIMRRSRQFADKVQGFIGVEFLFALPFGSLTQKPNLDGLNWGIWGHSLGQSGRLGDRVFLDLFKDHGALFVVVGDRMSREVLKHSTQSISAQIMQSLKMGVSPIVGITSAQELSVQIHDSFQGMPPEDLSKVTLLFYGGEYGHEIETEAEKIDQQVSLLRQIIEERYGSEVAKQIRVLLEISHFSRDPCSYMKLKAIDGISLSSAVLKGEFLLSERKAVEKVETIDELVKDDGKLEQSQSSFEIKESTKAELERQESQTDQTIEEGEPTVAQQVPIVETAQGKIKNTSKSGFEERQLLNDHQTEKSSSTQALRKVKNAAEGIARVKLTIAECADKLAENQFQRTYLPSETDLESPELKLERLKLEFKAKFEEFQRQCKKGWEILFRAMEENQEPKRDEMIHALNLPAEKIAEFTDPESISELFNRKNEKCWYEVLGLTKDQMDALYVSARHLFENKKYSEAAQAFFTLVSMNARDYRYWFGYGMAKKLEKTDLDTALDCFSIANTLNQAAPEPFIHAAECYIEKGNFSEAERCLTYGEQLLTDSGEYAYLKRWAERLTEKIGGSNEL